MSSDDTLAETLTRTEGILADLVAFPTLSGRSNRDIIDYIAACLGDHGITAHLDPHTDGERFNLFATIGPETDGGIALSGHTDVVPASPDQWTGDPFVLRREDGRLIGRGAVDMKGFLALALAMVPHFAADAKGYTLPLHLAITFDEEAGCFGSAQFGAFLDRIGIRPAIALIGEPTGMRPIAGHKAIIEMITHVHGSAGHASEPRGRVNAISYAARLVAKIEEIAHCCAAQPIEGSLFDPPCTTLNVGRIQGGEARNVIPDQVELLWEIRPTPPDDGRAVLDEIIAFANQTLVPEMAATDPAADIRFAELAWCPGLEPRPGSSAARLIERLWTNAAPTVVPYGTDGGHFQAIGLETIVFGPGRMDQMHQPEESIGRDELMDGLRFLTRLSDHLAGRL